MSSLILEKKENESQTKKSRFLNGIFPDLAKRNEVPRCGLHERNKGLDAPFFFFFLLW